MRPTRRQTLAGLAACLLPGLAAAAPAAQLIDPRWQRFGERGDPDHSAWTAFLARYAEPGIGGINRVAYGLAQAEGERPRAYVERLEQVDPATLTAEAAMAYWINLYNALTVDLVVEAWPVSSIKQVKGGLFNSGPWEEKLVRVAGADLSLDDIEHGILRPVWADNRVHYAVNCAAVGCPNLALEPYAADRLDGMLAAGARAYVNNPRGARVDEEGDLVVSSIYDWYRADFGTTDREVIGHLAGHADERLAQALSGITTIADYEYDWAVNAR